MTSRRDTASSIVAAPPAEVYAALVDPEALLAWLPPEGMVGEFEHFDARPGGSYRLALRYDAAPRAGGKTSHDSDVVNVRFVALEPGVRVVQAVVFDSADPSFLGTMTMTWTLTPVDGGTRVVVDADDVPDGISAEDHAAGLQSSLANLASFLSG